MEHEKEEHDYHNGLTQSASCTLCLQQCQSLKAVTEHMQTAHYHQCGGEHRYISCLDDVDDDPTPTTGSNSSHIVTTEAVSDDYNLRYHHAGVCATQCRAGGETFQSPSQSQKHLRTCQLAAGASTDSPITTDGVKKYNTSADQLPSPMPFTIAPVNSQPAAQNTEVVSTKPTQSLVCLQGCKKKQFSNMRALLAHKKDKHSAAVCFPCEKSLKNYCGLLQHMKMKHNTPVCVECECIFESEAELMQHASGHVATSPSDDAGAEAPVTGNFLCSVCGKSFTLDVSLQQHMRDKHDTGPHSCELCSDILRSGEDYKQHMRDEHGNIHKEEEEHGSCSTTDDRTETFSCPHGCSNTFPHKTALLQHQKDKHQAAVCLLCPKQFQHQRAMLQHLSMKHEMSVCLECEQLFKSADDLTHHQHNNHIGQGVVSQGKVSASTAAVSDVSSFGTLQHNEHQCDNDFATMEALAQHRQDKHSTSSLQQSSGGSQTVPSSTFFTAAAQDVSTAPAVHTGETMVTAAPIQHDQHAGLLSKLICPICDHNCESFGSLCWHVKVQHTEIVTPEYIDVFLNAMLQGLRMGLNTSTNVGFISDLSSFPKAGQHTAGDTYGTISPANSSAGHLPAAGNLPPTRSPEVHLLPVGSPLPARSTEGYLPPMGSIPTASSPTRHLTATRLHEVPSLPPRSLEGHQATSILRKGESMPGMSVQPADQHTHSCTVCGAPFQQPDDLKQHMQGQHMPSTQGLICLPSFTTPEQLEGYTVEKHMTVGASTSNHSSPAQQPLSYCDIVKKAADTSMKAKTMAPYFKSIYYSEYPDPSVVQPAIDVPSAIDSATSAMASVAPHGRSLHSYIIKQPNGLYKCCRCKMTSKSHQTIGSHLIEVHNIRTSIPVTPSAEEKASAAYSPAVLEAQPFVCERCLKRFGTEKGLNKHLQQSLCPMPEKVAKKHPNGKYHCEMPDCDQTYPSLAMIHQHMFDKHGVLEEQSTACPLCNRKLKSTMAHYQHMESVHRKTGDV